MDRKGKLIKFDQKYSIPPMGTSGVRQVREVFDQPGFLEQFLQGIADHLRSCAGDPRFEGKDTVVLGGDPRLGNPDRIFLAARIFTGNGFRVKMAVPAGLASTPAMSHAIRKVGALAGVVFTASHNPFTDVGVKLNAPDGSPALEEWATSVHTFQNGETSEGYYILSPEAMKESGLFEEIDTVALYADLADSIFDFGQMRDLIRRREEEAGRPFRIALDGMGGAAGPYLKEIFQKRLGLSPELLRAEPDPYLGGPDDPAHANHPEPDFSYLPGLIEKNATGEYDLVAGFDSDVDRRLNGGGGFWIESADEFAIFGGYGDLIRIESHFEKSREVVFARSTVTAPAIDLMRDSLMRHYGDRGYTVRILETATGFKWIAEYGNWGVEESNGLGNPWLREKDGIFATLFLFRIMLETGHNPRQLMEDVWSSYGRYFFSRGEVSHAPKLLPSEGGYEKERKDLEEEKRRLDSILDQCVEDGDLVGRNFGDLVFLKGERWNYVDPEGEIRARNAAYLFQFNEGVTVKMRFSGTGSGGYTLRVYITRFSKDYRLPKAKILQPVREALNALFGHFQFPILPGHYNDMSQPDPYAID